MPIIVNQSSLKKTSEGSEWKVTGLFNYTTYTTGGNSIPANKLGLGQLKGFQVDQEGGQMLDPEVATDEASVNIKVYNSTGGAFTPTPLAAETFNIVHSATAANANPVYASKGPGEEWQFNIETLPTGATQPGPYGVVSTSLANILNMKRGHIDEFMVKVTLNAAPPAGQEVFFKPTEFHNGFTVGILQSNHAAATTADWDFTCVDIATGLVSMEQIPVLAEPNSADGAYAVNWDPALATGSKIIVDSQFAETCFVRTQSGRYMQIPNGVTGTAIFFNEAAATSDVRLESTGASGSNLMLSLNGDLAIDGVTSGYLAAVESTTPGIATLQVGLSSVAPYAAGELVKVRINDRVVDATVVGAITGARVFYDASQAIGNRLRANFTGAATRTVALSTSERPQGYQPAGTVAAGPGGEVANGTDLSSLGAIEFEAWGL